MNIKPTILALRWQGKLMCPSCVSNAGRADEIAILQDPGMNARLMEERGIDVIEAAHLKGGEQCVLCGALIGTK